VKSGGGGKKPKKYQSGGTFSAGRIDNGVAGIRTADFESVGWKAVGCSITLTGALYLGADLKAISRTEGCHFVREDVPSRAGGITRRE